MSSAGLAEIEALLKSAIGVDAKLTGSAALVHAVKRRLAVLGLNDEAVYPALLRRSAAELQALIDEVVVPETWFFRDRGAFSALAALLPRDKRFLRVLSLPCATGEEAYNIAIALLAAGIPAGQFCVDALDVSPKLLGLAERAMYGGNSFRGADMAFRDDYFEPAEKGYRPIETVRRQVRFAPANLLDPALADLAPYDAVFCRNVLIYFDRATQEQVLRRLARVILPGGLLFVGPSEQSLAASCGFTSLRVSHAFVFRPESAAPPPAAPRRETLAAPLLPPPPPLRSALVASTAGFAARPDPLVLARQLADAGNFVEAEAACEAALLQHGTSAALFYLHGLIRDAAGHAADAVKLYRKALYLEPDHIEALRHLSLILHRRRDPSARILDARLARLLDMAAEGRR